MQGLNPDLLAAYDWTLLAAMSDWAREQGEEEVANALDFTRHHQLCPTIDHPNARNWGWWDVDFYASFGISWRGINWSMHVDGEGDRSLASGQLIRLLKVLVKAGVGRDACKS